MSKHNAKYAFYYLLSLAALIFVALSVGMIIFGVIDKTILDALAVNNSSSTDNQLKFAISALFIAGPTYYFLSRLINRGLHKKELEPDSPLRRWLTYFIILVAAVIILAVFVGVIDNFLAGELTVRFILKAVTMLIIAGAVFSFYFYDVKRQTIKDKDRVIRLFGWISAVLVLAVFITAWFFVQSPKLARAKRLDQLLVNNIYQLENDVNSYYSQYGRLPADLKEIEDSPDVYLDPKNLVDPETKQAIEYKKESEKKFSFCAFFRAASDESSDKSQAYNNSGNKDHNAGYDCLEGQLWSKVEAEAKTVQ